MNDKQRLGLGIVLSVILTRLSPGTGMGEWWNYVLIAISVVGMVMMVAPARE